MGSCQSTPVPSDLKLTYLPVRARAEPSRMMLKYFEVEFVDEVVTMHDWGTKLKAKTPYGQLPLVTAHGKVIAQSGTVLRYLADVAGAVPSDPIAAAQIDSIFELAQEFINAHKLDPVVNSFVPEEKCAEMIEAMHAAWTEKYQKCFENQLETFPGGPFFGGKTPMYCDFGVYAVVDNLRFVIPTLLEDSAPLQAFMTAFEALPRVKEYLASRPPPMGRVAAA